MNGRAVQKYRPLASATSFYFTADRSCLCRGALTENETKLETGITGTIAISSMEDLASDGPRLHNVSGPLP